MIPIQNIYYMLTYAFRILNEKGYKDLETEIFINISDLYAAIIINGVSLQLKRGLKKDYIPIKESTSSIKGKINISESIKTFSMINREMVCTYDEFSKNTYLNKVLKTTMFLLLKLDVKKERKKSLKKILMYFSEIDILDIHNINWNINYDTNNQSYKLLLTICKAVIRSVLQTEKKGSKRMIEFSDDQTMSKLYEKFLFEYYKKEFQDINVTAPYINWQLDDDYNELLPVMRTDLILSKENKILIIDAKYWTKMTQSYRENITNHSQNLYQIFSYVKNKQKELDNEKYETSGMLLYAKTDEEIVPDNSYSMSGNKIHVKTLDLNCNFKEIKVQLNKFIELI